MKRLDLTLVTSRTYIPCQFQSCVIMLLDFFFFFFDLRIMHALEMLNKKNYALFVNISLYSLSA